MEITIGQCEKYENQSDYQMGVRDALRDLTFEEAVACEFPNPYTAVIANAPLKGLFDLRRKKLLEEK